MSNRLRNRRRNLIPTAALPSGSYRTRLADGTRAWVINGENFASKSAYFQYLRDKALMDKIAASQMPAPTADADTVEIASVFGQSPIADESELPDIAAHDLE